MKVIVTLLLTLQFNFTATSQDNVSWRNFYPYHQGDIRQYRSLYVGDIIYTHYTDSVVDIPQSKDIIIYTRYVSGMTTLRVDKIDSMGNVFNLNYQPDYPRYKLAADSGESWIAGHDIIDGDTLATYIITVIGVFQSYVFDSLTTIKVFRFEMINECCGTFWLGNDYLAAGFGLVRTDVEPSDVYYLAGAIIDSNKFGAIVGVLERNQLIPQELQLYQNYPNPFNATTTIQYYLPVNGFVVMKVYDIIGREISTLVNSYQIAGEYQVFFTADNIPSGVYYYSLNISSQLRTKKFIYVK